MQRRSAVSVSESTRLGSILVAFATVVSALVLLLAAPAQGQRPSESGPPARTQATGSNPSNPAGNPDLITIPATNCTVSEGASVTLEDDEGETLARFVDGQQGIEITATESQIEIEGPDDQFIGDSATFPDPNDTSFSTNGNYTVAASTGITCQGIGTQQAPQGQQPLDDDTGAAEVQYAADRDDEVITATIPKKTLPLTGGMPLAGLALIGFGSFVAGVSVFRFGVRR
jgi:hypothetical protein